METTRIQQNQTERIEVFLTDYDNDPITGASIDLMIRRKSDDKILDFNDNTFKSSGWTNKTTTMTEVDATNDAGRYKYDFDTTGFSDDEYLIRADYSSGGVTKRFNGEVKVGDYVDNINATISSRSTLTAQQVWEYGTRTLTSFGSLIANIWASATRTLTDPNSYKADVSSLATSSEVSALETKVEKNYKENEQRTFYIATSQVAARNVDVGKYSKEKVEIKADDASNWDSPIDTYWRYYWYETMGDDQPEKVTGEST